MKIEQFKYEETDTISDTIISFYKELTNKEQEQIEKIIELYINNKSFYNYIQKNILIKKIDTNYLIRLYNDFDNDNLIDSYDTIVVNTSRWI